MTLLGPIMCDLKAPGFERIVPRDAGSWKRIPNGVMGLPPGPNP